MGINSCRRPLVRIVHVETCEESILKADLNILQQVFDECFYRLSATLDQNLSRIQMRVTEQRNKHTAKT